MTQTTLADFAGMLSEVRDRVKRMENALKRSQSTASFYQTRYGEIKQTVMTLKDELTRQHQAELYRSNEGRFATLRRQVYEFFRDVTFESWNAEEAPHGVYWKNAFLEAKGEAWLTGVDGATYRRRLNELADKRVTNPPLLEWKKPGYYVLAQIEKTEGVEHHHEMPFGRLVPCGVRERVKPKEAI
jgi:hypothetical protein